MLECFNSIKVRLEHCVQPAFGPTPRCFNSIKVRLERTIAHALCAEMLFQFHKGAIRTPSATTAL
mgnify:CR=1 FL=1